MDVISWAGVVSGLVGSIITIVVGVKKFHSYVIVPILNHFNQCRQCFLDVAAMKKKLEYELNPNGGNSLRDQLQNYSKTLARLENLTLCILQSSNKEVLLFDESALCLWGNLFYTSQLGWKEEELLGLGWKNAICEKDRDRVCHEFFESVRDGRESIISFSYVSRDDSNVFLRVKAVCHPVKRSGSDIIGFVSFASKIDAESTQL